MAILLVIILVGAVAALILGLQPIGFGRESKRMKILHILLLDLTVVVSLICFIHGTSSITNTVDGAEQVAMIEPRTNLDNGNVYFDADENMYFILRTNPTDVITPIGRCYLDSDTAKAYVETYKDLIDSMEEK